MTNDELNTAVAEGRGWTEHPDYDGMIWVDSDGRYHEIDVCSSPTAWGALLEEIAAESDRLKRRDNPMVGRSNRYPHESPHPRVAMVGTAVAASSSPGRALALAFLKSKGVEA